MKSWVSSAALATLLVAVIAPNLVNQVNAADLREAVPPDMFLAVYGRHNPERDYQRKHFEAVWDAVEKSGIAERVVQLIQSRMSEGDLEQMLEFRDSLKQALAPIEWKKLSNVQEVVYGQKMEGAFTQNIVMIRFPEGGAASLLEAVNNLLKMVDDAADENISVIKATHSETKLSTLLLPSGVPLSPTFGLRGDLFIYSSNPELAKQCLALLDDPAAESKFDDPRVAVALSHLPEAEDALVFFDGKALSQQLKGIVTFINGVAAGNDEALRVADLIDSLLDEVDFVDHEITVEYTDGFRNRTSTFGRNSENAAGTVLGKMTGGQQPFSDWAKWVPANATSFSLQSGANLRPLYTWITTKVPEVFPESEEFFFEFEKLQGEYDVRLDADILQGFSGESVSISLPGAMTPLGPAAKSVTFLRCQKPERIRELIQRGFDALQQIPQVQAQGVAIKPSEKLEGFEEVRAGFFMMMGGMTPTFGFRDGWMISGSHADAIESVLQSLAGDGESIATSERFTQFGIEVTGDVNAISYSNTGETIRQLATGMQQAGAMIPMMLAMAGSQNGAPNLEPVKDVLALLPGIGRILAKCDFIESTLSVTQPGPEAGTWVRHSVTMIRPPDEQSSTTGQ